MTDLKEFVEGYISAVYFTETGDCDQPSLDVVLAPAARAAVEEICKDFVNANSELLDIAYATGRYDCVRAGVDFWFTRNGHGVGYWDRGLDATGEELTRAAKVYSTSDAYVADDGFLYLT